MDNKLQAAKQNFIQGMSRAGNFWGFPKAMGAIYGAIYLSPEPMSLDEMVSQVGITKGAVSTNVRQLERLGMVHKHIIVGERKDYYIAETEFWDIVKGILKEREQSEFDQALRTVGESLQMVESSEQDTEKELAKFYTVRMQAMQSFFATLDSLVATLLALENAVSINAIKSLLNRKENKSRKETVIH